MEEWLSSVGGGLYEKSYKSKMASSACHTPAIKLMVRRFGGPQRWLGQHPRHLQKSTFGQDLQILSHRYRGQQKKKSRITKQSASHVKQAFSLPLGPPFFFMDLKLFFFLSTRLNSTSPSSSNESSLDAMVYGCCSVIYIERNA